MNSENQFLDAGEEVSYDFIQHVLLATNDVRSYLSALVTAAPQVPQLEMNKLLLSAGICW